MLTAARIRAHIAYMRSKGQDWYVDGDDQLMGALAWYWNLLSPYL